MPYQQQRPERLLKGPQTLELLEGGQQSGFLKPGEGGCCRVVSAAQFKLAYGEVRASLIAQLVKNPPTMQESPVRFLGREDPLEK